MRIGVLTSGGDAPGMNAAIRTIAAVGIGRGHSVLGIRSGYAGLLEGDVMELDLPAVFGISGFGGTILALEAGAHDIMLAWDVESDYGTSPVVKYRVDMLRKVEDLLLL